MLFSSTTQAPREGSPVLAGSCRSVRRLQAGAHRDEKRRPPSGRARPRVARATLYPRPRPKRPPRAWPRPRPSWPSLLAGSRAVAVPAATECGAAHAAEAAGPPVHLVVSWAGGDRHMVRHVEAAKRPRAGPFAHRGRLPPRIVRPPIQRRRPRPSRESSPALSASGAQPTARTRAALFQPQARPSTSGLAGHSCRPHKSGDHSPP